MSQMKRCVVVDVDGTLANLDHRLPLVRRELPDWDTFYESCDGDQPNWWCVHLVRALLKYGYSIMFVTARRMNTYDKTKVWIDRYIGPGDHHLFMVRGNNDHTEDKILKKQWLNNSGLKEHIEFVVDDRQKVVNMWRGEGLKCLQCDAWEEYSS